MNMDSLDIRRGRRRRSWGPLLMELLMAMLIFALVSSAATVLFARASALSAESSRLSWASDQAGDISAIFRTSDSVQAFSDTLNQAFPQTAVSAGSTGRTVLTQRYTAALKPTARAKGAAVTVRVTAWSAGGTMHAHIVIWDRHKMLYQVSCRRQTGS
jgi:hypothetical protein